MTRVLTLRAALACAVAFLVACDSLGRGGPAGPVAAPDPHHLNAPAPGASAVDRPHVVFSERELVITELGVPTRAPVSAGSQASEMTMRSENPSIVAVAPDGMLVGLAPGRARVVTLSGEGSVLDVEVREARALALEPASLTVEAGRSAEFRLVDAVTQEDLSPKAAEWSSSAPGTATVRSGVVHAGNAPGVVEVTARYGGREVRGEVVVRDPRGALEVTPARLRLKVGQVALVQAMSPGGSVAAAWTATSPEVVAAPGGGLVQGRRAGRSRLCAHALGQKACADVEVKP